MNDEMKFDPLTGEPINKNKTNNQTEIQSIATVDQSNNKFIDNMQNEIKKQSIETKDKTSYLFIIILFVIIFIAIIFLFPIINKYL